MDTTSQIFLRSPRWKLLLFLLFSIVLVAVGVWEIRTGEYWWGLATISLFGLATLSLAVALISDRFHSLRIDPTGFTFCNCFRSRHLSWNDVTAFGVTRVTRTEFIAWNYSATAKRPAGSVFMDMMLLGFDAGCPAIGMRAKDLLALMQRFHARYAKATF
jgi:hypothetical protein